MASRNLNQYASKSKDLVRNIDFLSPCPQCHRTAQFTNCAFCGLLRRGARPLAHGSPIPLAAEPREQAGIDKLYRPYSGITGGGSSSSNSSPRNAYVVPSDTSTRSGMQAPGQAYHRRERKAAVTHGQSSRAHAPTNFHNSDMEVEINRNRHNEYAMQGNPQPNFRSEGPHTHIYDPQAEREVNRIAQERYQQTSNLRGEPNTHIYDPQAEREVNRIAQERYQQTSNLRGEPHTHIYDPQAEREVNRIAQERYQQPSNHRGEPHTHRYDPQAEREVNRIAQERYQQPSNLRGEPHTHRYDPQAEREVNRIAQERYQQTSNSPDAAGLYNPYMQQHQRHRAESTPYQNDPYQKNHPRFGQLYTQNNANSQPPMATRAYHPQEGDTRQVPDEVHYLDFGKDYNPEEDTVRIKFDVPRNISEIRMDFCGEGGPEWAHARVQTYGPPQGGDGGGQYRGGPDAGGMPPHGYHGDGGPYRGRPDIPGMTHPMQPLAQPPLNIYNREAHPYHAAQGGSASPQRRFSDREPQTLNGNTRPHGYDVSQAYDDRIHGDAAPRGSRNANTESSCRHEPSEDWTDCEFGETTVDQSMRSRDRRSLQRSSRSSGREGKKGARRSSRRDDRGASRSVRYKSEASSGRKKRSSRGQKSEFERSSGSSEESVESSQYEELNSSQRPSSTSRRDKSRKKTNRFTTASRIYEERSDGDDMHEPSEPRRSRKSRRARDNQRSRIEADNYFGYEPARGRSRRSQLSASSSPAPPSKPREGMMREGQQGKSRLRTKSEVSKRKRRADASGNQRREDASSDSIRDWEPRGFKSYKDVHGRGKRSSLQSDNSKWSMSKWKKGRGSTSAMHGPDRKDYVKYPRLEEDEDQLDETSTVDTFEFITPKTAHKRRDSGSDRGAVTQGAIGGYRGQQSTRRPASSSSPSRSLSSEEEVLKMSSRRTSAAPREPSQSVQRSANLSRSAAGNRDTHTSSDESSSSGSESAMPPPTFAASKQSASKSSGSSSGSDYYNSGPSSAKSVSKSKTSAYYSSSYSKSGNASKSVSKSKKSKSGASGSSYYSGDEGSSAEGDDYSYYGSENK